MIRTLAALAALALATLAPAAAQDDAALDLGGDSFRAGSNVVMDTPASGDVFLAGERIALSGEVAGAAHLAARRVETTGSIGGALYAMGQDVRVAGPVAGAASLAGYDVVVTGPIGGNLRAFGRTVDLRAPVAGAALITGARVELAAAVSGDAAITAETVTFGPDARIDGRLTLYADPDAPIAVPTSVVPPERLDRRPLRAAGMAERMTGPGWAALALAFLFGALILAALGAFVAAVAPRSVARLGAIIAEGPFRAFGFGFLTQSALIGGAILAALTLIGVLAAPFFILAAGLIGLLGYVLAVYLLGARIVTHFGALEADTLPEYALASFVGALVAGLLGLVPILGWLALIALSLTGVGALTIARLRPRYGL